MEKQLYNEILSFVLYMSLVLIPESSFFKDI